MFIDVTGEKVVQDAIQPSLHSFLRELPGDVPPTSGRLLDFYNEPHPWVAKVEDAMAKTVPIRDEGFVVPTQVSYVGKGGKLYDEGEYMSGSVLVASRFLKTGYLWDHIRVIGGAYGGFCSFDPRTGNGLFSFLSYRDPNLGKTLDAYDAAAEALLTAARGLEDDPEAMATAIIGTVGDLDGALSPDQKGNVARNRWFAREGPDRRQRFRDEVLATTPDDFRAFAERLRVMKGAAVAVVSSRDALDNATKEGRKLHVTQLV